MTIRQQTLSVVTFIASLAVTADADDRQPAPPQADAQPSVPQFPKEMVFPRENFASEIGAGHWAAPLR